VLQGLSALHARLRVDQVGQALHLRHVQLVVVEGALGKLSRRGRAQALKTRQSLRGVGVQGCVCAREYVYGGREMCTHAQAMHNNLHQKCAKKNERG